MLDWSQIRTVFLDMDGTLLDLHFDNYFWNELIPQRYAERHGMALPEAKAALEPHFRRVEGTIHWYCLDYWTDLLGLDVALLKREVQHLIAVHPHVLAFLDAVRASGRRSVLVTNAHAKSLALKLERTPIGGHLDAIVSSHDSGYPKESRPFWDWLMGHEPFEPRTTLLVDDSLPVLRTARAFGIAHLIAVANPDSRGAPREVVEFPSIRGFDAIMPS